MHFDVLVEDKSGKVFLDVALRKLVTDGHTFKVNSYRGIGHVPKNLVGGSDPSKRMLLDQLPRLLRGYGTVHSKYPPGYSACVMVICDLDERDFPSFVAELKALKAACRPWPDVAFCLAIEEGEAWLLGDANAIKQAYPNVKKSVLASYVNDSICGTWEILADAVFPGGAQALKSNGYPAVGIEKSRWAGKIAPFMNFDTNMSPSFRAFLKALRKRL